jgi:hypothetical protein
MTDTFDDPTDIGSITLNFRSACVQRKILDHDGVLLDLEAFKLALVSSMKKPIVVESLAEYHRLNEEGKLCQPILTQILVHVAWLNNDPVGASLRQSKLPPDAEIATYVCKLERDKVCLAGEPTLGPMHQRQMFLSLAEDVAAARIFDDESPQVARALRDTLDRR